MNLHSYIWFGSNMILFAFTWFFIPETRDRTLEEIHEMFENNVPARKFKSYVCTSTEAMAKAALKRQEAEGETVHMEDMSSEGRADGEEPTTTTTTKPQEA